MMRTNLILLLLVLSNIGMAQSRQTPTQYKEKFDQDAVVEMIKSGVPASITLAQGMLESDYGNSSLAKKSTQSFWNKMPFQLDRR